MSYGLFIKFLLIQSWRESRLGRSLEKITIMFLWIFFGSLIYQKVLLEYHYLNMIVLSIVKKR